jgi:hypothetical protein
VRSAGADQEKLRWTLLQGRHGHALPEAEAREPLQHWHSAPYATLEGYRLECDAQRMMASGATHGYAPVKGELGQCDPLSQLQASAFFNPGLYARASDRHARCLSAAKLTISVACA